MNRKYLFSLLMCFAYVFASAQYESNTESTQKTFFSDINIGINIGMSSYEGDVNCFKENEINVFTKAHFSFGVNIFKQITDKFSIGFQFMNTRLSGSDDLFTSNKGHAARGFSFQNKINELTLNVQYEPFESRNWRISPILTGGIGYTFGKAVTDYKRNIQPQARIIKIDEDIQNIPSGSVSIPLGIGLKTTVNQRISIILTAALRFGLNDFIDGVSNSGNSSVNDYYGVGDITFRYNLGSNLKNQINIKEY